MAMDKQSEAYSVIQDEYYPSGSSLSNDRKKLAQTVFKPSEVDKWLEKGINKSDLQGYDTPDAREPSQRAVLSRLHSSTGLGYVESEPERFLHEGQETRKLLETIKGEVTGYEAFKTAVDKAWTKDRSLRELVKNMTESDYQALYKQPIIQRWLSGNTGEVIIKALMQRFKLERPTAESTYARMNDAARTKFYTALLRGGRMRLRQAPEVAQPEPEPTPAPRVAAEPALPLLRQRSRGGQMYSRRLPIQWTELQLTFLRSNRTMPLPALTTLYNSTFGIQRTQASIKSRRQRLAR